MLDFYKVTDEFAFGVLMHESIKGNTFKKAISLLS